MNSRVRGDVVAVYTNTGLSLDRRIAAVAVGLPRTSRFGRPPERGSPARKTPAIAPRACARGLSPSRPSSTFRLSRRMTGFGAGIAETVAADLERLDAVSVIGREAFAARAGRCGDAVHGRCRHRRGRRASGEPAARRRVAGHRWLSATRRPATHNRAHHRYRNRCGERDREGRRCGRRHLRAPGSNLGRARRRLCAGRGCLGYASGTARSTDGGFWCHGWRRCQRQRWRGLSRRSRRRSPQRVAVEQSWPPRSERRFDASAGGST